MEVAEGQRHRVERKSNCSFSFLFPFPLTGSLPQYPLSHPHFFPRPSAYSLPCNIDPNFQKVNLRSECLFSFLTALPLALFRLRWSNLFLQLRREECTFDELIGAFAGKRDGYVRSDGKRRKGVTESVKNATPAEKKISEIGGRSKRSGEVAMECAKDFAPFF